MVFARVVRARSEIRLVRKCWVGTEELRPELSPWIELPALASAWSLSGAGGWDLGREPAVCPATGVDGVRVFQGFDAVQSIFCNQPKDQGLSSL